MSVLFSIILPTYNRASFLPKAINSVLGQSSTNWELIIVDDGSTDSTKQVVKSFTDERIKYIYQDNAERSSARNNGIKQAKGEWICFLDSDDYIMPDHLWEFDKIIEKNGSKKAIYYCNTLVDNCKEVKEVKNSFVVTKTTKEFVLLNVIGVPRVCMHTSIATGYLFNPKFNIGEDRELWSRIAENYPFIPNNAFTAVFIEHEGRSVGLANEQAFLKNIEVLKYIVANDKSELVRNSIRKKVLSIAYFNLARHYEFVNKKIFFYHAILISVVILPNHRLKEKVFMMLNNCKFTQWLLKLR